MTARLASVQEIYDWNNLIISNPDMGNVTQSFEMSKLKQKSGWKINYIIAKPYAITIQERNIFGFGKLWYIPKGPGLNTPTEVELLLPDLKKIAKKNNVFLIKIEPEIIKNDNNINQLSRLDIITNRPIQPNFSTVIIDITGNTNDIMVNLPQKSRHAIKRAYRDGVTTKLVEPTSENFKIMASLISQTMANKSIMIRSQDYYMDFWKTYTSSGLGSLFFAYYENKPVAGAFVLTFGSKATYKDGGSVRERTAYGASHALQWHIIEWLSKKGIKKYDLCGSPPASEIGNPKHPHYGIGLFKTSFNKKVTEFVGLYDVPVKNISYKVWSIVGERVIYNFYARILHKLFY
jgi:lipid II:glycine glycyltransferase (peptidoglycan interpeptide bridge formation enzyme)